MEVALEPSATTGSCSSSKLCDIYGLDEPQKQQRVRVRRRTLKTMLEKCQRDLELLNNADVEDPVDGGGNSEENDEDVEVSLQGTTSPSSADSETDALCDLLKSRVDSPSFLEKLGSIHMSITQNSFDESTSWDVVTATDLWEDKNMDGGNGSDQDDYVLVRQEDIVDGIACFMAAYLLSLNQAKDLTPNQLQEALSKTFSTKKKKGKLQKAWDGSKVIYNVASWGATAIGIYQNPALIGAASAAFWTSCRVISKLF